MDHHVRDTQDGVTSAHFGYICICWVAAIVYTRLWELRVHLLDEIEDLMEVPVKVVWEYFQRLPFWNQANLVVPRDAFLIAIDWMRIVKRTCADSVLHDFINVALTSTDEKSAKGDLPAWFGYKAKVATKNSKGHACYLNLHCMPIQSQSYATDAWTMAKLLDLIGPMATEMYQLFSL